MRIALLIILLCFTSLCYSNVVYEQKDANGNISYTDKPTSNTANAIPVETSTPTISTSSTTQSAPTKPEVEERKPYTTFAILIPQDQTTFQNQREIPVQIKIEPKLQLGDVIQLIVDGTPYGKPVEGTTLLLNQLDRGSHTVAAMILSKKNEVFNKTAVITIYVQYARLGPNNQNSH